MLELYPLSKTTWPTVDNAASRTGNDQKVATVAENAGGGGGGGGGGTTRTGNDQKSSRLPKQHEKKQQHVLSRVTSEKEGGKQEKEKE